MARVDIGRSSLRERRRRRRIVFWSLVAAAIFLIYIFLCALTWAPFLRITTVNVTGNKMVSASSIEDSSWSALSGGYGYVLARNDIFLYPRKTMIKELLAQFPALSSVAINATGFHTLTVGVTERQPVALWCGESVATSSSCFLLDKDGVIYAPAVVYSDDAYQRYYGGASGEVLPQQFLSAVAFHSLTALVTSLEVQQKITSQSVTIDENNDVHLAFDNGFTLLFAASTDSAQVLQAFDLALSSDPFKSHKLSDFDYLDLRFGDKLYYKLKGS